ncbi:hypothetical protein N0V85_005119 [Neurospora sp. IMI 360204]|nr:hypothetical protein N0V85_005119 [Neurospora sp. IMI 360204]
MRDLLHHRGGTDSDSRSVAQSETQSDAAHRHELLFKVQNALAGIIGLGALPPIIPPGREHHHCKKRPVFIAWHPVAENLGVLFAEHTRLGQAITKEMGEFPDPTNHWAVIVGDHDTDYYHELWMEKDFTVVNQHGLVGTQKWTNKLKVGETGWNDQAVLAASNKAIKEMKPRYGLIDNNCQIFASHLLLQLGIKMGTDINTAQDMRDKLLAEFSKTSTSWRKKLTNKDWQAPTFLKVQEIRRSISPAFGGSVEPQPEPHEEVVMQERQAKIRPFSWGKKKEVVAQLPTPP